uniref:Major facilitator superfamily (MFS) profile domain-containing protein n=1 Tax=Anopheles epiroticus TaxID=199890 RepID=A0A182PNN8_9DIPT
MDSPDDSYDEIMAQAGNDGKFQRRYNLIFNFGAICFASMSYMSIILALNKPPHNCHVPGMDRYNITDANLWKNLTLPRETDNRGQLGFSKCQMYNVTEQHLQRHYSEWSFGSDDIIDCAYGYDYDRTYYDRTPITEYDWVCDKGFRETNIFIYNRLGELVGTVIFGHLGDTLGRRPVFYLSILIITVGRLISMFTAAYYVVFCIAAAIGSMSAQSILQSPLIIAMEISKSELRGRISMVQCFGWTTGLCILAMVFWATKDWFWSLMIITVPIALFMFIPRYTIESPRWLATQGNYREAMVQLRRIASINGIRELAFDEQMLEKQLANHRSDTVIVCSVTYLTLVLLSSRMDGNPFLNFMYQALIEVPAALVAQRASDRVGRRATNAVALVCAAAVCFILVLIVRDPASEMAATALVTFVKFCIGITFFVVNLRSIEIYPTCLRQTGLSVGTIAATIFGIVGPYVVHLGTEYDVRYPYLVMGFTSAVGAMAALFLPETLHQSLPNTIEETQQFGKHQRFWSLPKPPKATAEQEDGTDKRPYGGDAKPEESMRLAVSVDDDEKAQPTDDGRK